jgi:hypothetical protein
MSHSLLHKSAVFLPLLDQLNRQVYSNTGPEGSNISSTVVNQMLIVKNSEVYMYRQNSKKSIVHRQILIFKASQMALFTSVCSKIC